MTIASFLVDVLWALLAGFVIYLAVELFFDPAKAKVAGGLTFLLVLLIELTGGLR